MLHQFARHVAGLAICSLMLATHGLAQAPTPESQATGGTLPDSLKPSEDPTASKQQSTPAVVLPPKAAYKHGYKIKTEYDKFEDRTVTTLDKLWRDTDGFTNQSSYKLTPSFWYKGTGQVASLDAVHISLLMNADVEVGKEAMSGAVAQQSKFAQEDNRQLILLVDGAKRIDLGAGNYDAGLSKRSFGSEILGSDRKIKEVVTYDVSLADWAAIAGAQGLIEGRFGKKAFKFDKKQIEAIRDFTSRMLP